MRFLHTLILLVLLLSLLTCLLCRCTNKTKKAKRTKSICKKPSVLTAIFGQIANKMSPKKRAADANENWKIPKFECKNDQPIMANSTSFSTKNPDNLYCRAEQFPCTQICYFSHSCFLPDRRDDFIVKYGCYDTGDEEESWRCDQKCCHSNATQLYNCTWHYTTDKFVGKGEDVLLVVRRVDYRPFMVEICAVHKINDSKCGAFWPLEIIKTPSQSGPNPNPNPNVNGPQPVNPLPATLVQTANLGLLGNLAQLGLLGLKGCDPIDILFIIDGSGSLRPSGFNNEKLLVKGILGYFDFSTAKGAADQSRAALVMFTNTANVLIKFDQFSSSKTANSDLLSTINSVAYPNAEPTDTTTGITAANQLFSSSTKRSGARRVTVLITDGVPNAPLSTSANVATAISTLQGVTGETIYAVGATLEDTTFLSSKFGIPADHTAYVAESDLSTMAGVVVSNICAKTTAAAATTTPTPSTCTAAPGCKTFYGNGCVSATCCCVNTAFQQAAPPCAKYHTSDAIGSCQCGLPRFPCNAKTPYDFGCCDPSTPCISTSLSGGICAAASKYNLCLIGDPNSCQAHLTCTPVASSPVIPTASLNSMGFCV